MKRFSMPIRGCLRAGLFRSCAEGEQGSILVQAALSMSLLCGMLALAVDVGRFLHIKRELQTLADASAQAGALELASCGSTSNCAAMQSAAKSALVENGIASSNITVVTQCGTTKATGMILYVNNPPCWVGSSDPYSGSSSNVETVVSYNAGSIFAGVIGKSTFKVMARAESGIAGKPKYCVFILGSGTQTLLENGNATLTASCGVIVNSAASPAAIFNGNDTITTTGIDVVGSIINNGNNTISPAVSTGAKAVSDPLSSLATPPVGACGSSTSSPYTGATNQVVVNSKQSVTFNAGTYCNGIIINGQATATFNPGTYVIKNGMTANGGDTISGTGVTFYMQSGQFIMNGNSHAVLSAPTSGTYEGMLYWQDKNDSNQMIINGDTTSKWQGVIYTPGAQVVLNGGSNVAAYTDFVVQSLIQNGNVNFTIGSDFSSLTHGAPIKTPATILPLE